MSTNYNKNNGIRISNYSGIEIAVNIQMGKGHDPSDHPER